MALKKQIMAFSRLPDIQKRAADWLEKISVGSILVGVFQEQYTGIIIGILTVAISFWLSWSIYKKRDNNL